MNATLEQFTDEMREAGLDPAELPTADGVFRRIRDNQDKPGKKDLYYILHGDGIPAGNFGHWSRLPDGQNWQAKPDNTLTPQERIQIKERIEQSRAARDKARDEVRAACRIKAGKMLEAAQDVSADHAYLVKKSIKPYGGRQLRDMLLIPVRKGKALTGLQIIMPDGSKKFLTGTEKAGAYLVIKGKGKTVYLTEGWATGCTIHELTGATVIICYDCGNLEAVSKEIRATGPDYDMVLVADNDRLTAGNPGLTKARAAALATGARLAIPDFPGDDGTDANDLAAISGAAAVLACLEAAALVTSGPSSTAETTGDQWPEPIDLKKLSLIEPLPPKFIMPGWLPCGYATMFSGHGGAGKSSIGLILIVCMALGLDFFGNPVEQRKVLFLSCEDRIQILHWRLAHICRFFGISIEALFEHLFILDLVGHDNILYQPSRRGAALTPVYRELSNRMKQYSAQVLVVDGISDTFDGNENSRAEPKAFVNSLLSLVPAEDGALILLGHVAKASANNAQTSEGYSGSTAWHNAVRARWYLYPETKTGYSNRPESTGKLILELQKSNLGKADKSMCFEWDDAANMFAHVEIAEESHFDKNYRETQERNGILSAIVKCTVDIPAACSGQRTAFHVLAAQPDFPFSASSSNAEKKRFWQHIEALRAKGMLRDNFITRADRHKVRTLVATDQAISHCGLAGNDEKNITRTIAAPANAGMRAMPQGGYIGGDYPAHSEITLFTESDFVEGNL